MRIGGRCRDYLAQYEGAFVRGECACGWTSPWLDTLTEVVEAWSAHVEAPPPDGGPPAPG